MYTAAHAELPWLRTRQAGDPLQASTEDCWGESAHPGRSAAKLRRASPSAHPAGVEQHQQMRIASKTATVVLTLVAALCAIGAGSAIAASTGGASAPAEAAVAPGTVRPSGIATWFGPGFYGKKTACGQTLTPSVLGVANRTLPCGTLVKVGFKNRSVTLPVLDRGPYSHHADWDLTAGAAHALGVSETVRIETQVVGRLANSPTLGLPAAVPAEALAGGAAAG